MIPPQVVVEAQRLLAEGLSRRAVARQMGISRGTVDNIAHGRRKPDDVHGRRKPDDLDDSPGWNLPIFDKSRCPGCGAWAAIPEGHAVCLACLTRRHRPNPRPCPVEAAADENHEANGDCFDLRPEHRRRLEEVRRARAEQELADRGEAVIAEARRLLAGGATQTDVADQLGISTQTVAGIAEGGIAGGW